MKKTVLATLLGVALAAPLAVSAAADDPGLHFILSAGLTGGGDKVDTVDYTNGDSVNIGSGSLLQLGGGVLWKFYDAPIATSLTVNYHVDSADGRNGSVTFDRVPVEAIGYYTGVQNWRFGAGVRFVQSPTYTYDVGSTYQKVRFENTTGALIEAGYGFTPSMWLNLRYVSERYREKRGQAVSITNGQTLDGSHVGINFLYQF